MVASTAPNRPAAASSRLVHDCRHGRRQASSTIAETASRHQATEAAGMTANNPMAKAAPQYWVRPEARNSAGAGTRSATDRWPDSGDRGVDATGRVCQASPGDGFRAFMPTPPAIRFIRSRPEEGPAGGQPTDLHRPVRPAELRRLQGQPLFDRALSGSTLQ